MAELYAKPYEVIDTGYNPQQMQQGSQDAEMQSYLDSLPPEERQKAIERINAPLTGEELALMAKSGERLPTLEEYAEIEKFHKNHEVSFIDGLGRIAEGGEQVMNDLVNAATSFWKDPADATSKMPATAVEAFAQGTRNFYGMLAQSQNPDSVLFRVKDFLNGTGTLEDRYNQYIEALKFNRQSAELVEGKQTLVMDKDLINHEVTQAMAYIADPTLFIPFGKVASTGLRAVGLGEKLTMAGARAAAIKNGIIGNTIKWGAGQPLEFLGGAVRNTIDYGLEKAGSAFEATTGIGAKEFAQTARMSGIGFSASAIAGHAVPYASTISDAYLVGSSARGFGEALTLLGDTMKKNQFGRGINSWAAESLAQAEKNGVALSPHAKGLLKTLNAVDPLFAYGWNGLEGAAEGALIGGGLGYLSDGAEGMYSGIGAGIALGGVGATAGKVVADVTGGTNVARRAVQAKMVIEGHKVTNPEKAMFFQAMQKAAEIRGKDVDLVNGIIAGIDNVAPNFEFHALTPDQFEIEAKRKGYNPETGKFRETSALDIEFGADRASKSRAMYVLRSVGGDFVGNRQGFLDALKKASAKDSANPNKPASNIPLNLRKYIDVAKTFEKLSKTQQEAILKEIDGQGAVASELGGKTKLREYYDALTWSEAWTDSIVKKFESDREGARKDIAEMLAQETDKNGKLNSKGRALADKLRAEGFLDKDNKLLRERNLLNADLTLSQFTHSKGAVIGREADGKTHMYINLSRMGDETFPHELFHTIMRESPMKKHFTDTLVHKLLGTVDKDGNLVRPAEINIGQIERFFKRYIELANRNPDGTPDVGTADSLFKQVQDALTEYRNAGENKKISDKARSLLENYTEEFGAYYFSHWLMGRNRNTLFFGGELKGIEGLVERAKDSFKDFWQSKISKSNPEFDFSRGLNEAFDRSKGLGRISAMDYYMRDMVRAASNANKEVFRPDSMTLENLRDFERSNGLRNLTTPEGTRRLNPREQVTQNIRLGKEAYKILSGLDKNLRTSKDVLDENGKQIITGRLSEAELDALVKGGIVPRAWADKVNQGYAMLDGTVSNIFSAGYLGRTEQTTDASYPRLTGKDVSFKNRKAVLFDVETKIKADGTFYTLFHTLDLAVIEQRGNHLWQNVDYRNLWNGDRAAFEADFFRYISNASKASTDPKKLDSATLFETGDGNGAKRRDVMHQMAGMALQTGDAYKHQPIAVIPEGIRHSVTTFNIDGMTMPRIETGTRYDINMGNAHKFIRENWQPAEMKQEKTPSGTLFTHETGFKFSAINGKYSAYSNDGSKIGTYGTIKEATFAAKNLYNKAQENIKKIANDFKQKEEQNRKNLQPLDEATYEEAFRIGDMFKTKRMQEIIGDSKLVRQTFDEFRDQKVEEIISGKNEQEKGAILNQLFSSEFKELIDLEAELKKTYDEFGLEARQLQEQETEITKRIVEFSQEKKRLQESGNPDAKLDIHILEMYERIYKRKQEVNKRLSEIIGKMHNEGITDLNSHYYITKRFLQNFNETGKLSEEAVKFAITPRLIKAYEANFETGKAVTFLANHGTPNHELMVSKTFDMGFLGRNTGSMSAFNATFFAGSKETSVNYVGNPIAKTWVRDFIQARKYYVKNFSPEIKAKLESLLSSDTSKGVVQKVSALMANAHIEFPDDFKLKDTGRKTKEGEPIIKPQPETQLGWDIDSFLDRALEGANDEGFSIGGYEMAWNEEGKKPYLLRNIVKMENPYVHEYAKADYRDETFASVIRRAKEAGHDGVIFKNTKDGGGLDTIFASFAKNEDNKIFTLETTEDTRFAPRGTDEAGNKVKGGSEIEGRNYQPSEDIYSGGRVYDQNSKQFKSGFVGLYAAENPDRVKGVSLQFMKRADGSHRIRLTDNSKKGESADIGHITANIEGDRATLSAHINEAYRGKKLAYVVYSEMAERLRAMGVTAVDGQIVNPDGIPIKVREKIIGDTRDLNTGRRINYVEGANRIRDKQELMGKMAGVDVTNTLYKQGRYQPDEKLPPSRDQGFNRIYRQISRSKKASARSIKQTYLDKWGIDLNDYERYKQLEDAVLDLEFRRNNNEYEGTDREYLDERQELLNEFNELESNLTDQITNTQGDYAHRFNDQEGEITSGLKSIDRLVDDISRVSLDDVDRFSGTNRLDALLRRRLGSGFAQEITGDNIFIADAFREYAGMKYEREMIGKAFESELYSSEFDKMDYTGDDFIKKLESSATFKNRKGTLIDILRSENKLTKEGNPQGEVNPRRIINALRNKSGGDSKVYAEAKAIGLIDWLESKQEGKNQKKVTTKELIEFAENNKMGLAIDPQLEQAADFGSTRPYVTGGEEQAKKGYRVYVVRMMNPKHQHGVEGHFGGAVVHVRVTLRDTKDGKKVMHIEEIQANNTATGVLSDAQRKIVKEEVGLFEQLKQKKEKILDERHDNQMAVDSDDTLTSAEKLDTKLQMRERSRKEIDALHAEYAEKIFQANREEWKDIYAHQPQRDDAGYIKLIKSSLEARGVDIFISERETKLNAKKSDAPLQDPKEWVKVAFRTVLRKALVEGVDRITITPWSETPLQVGMKAKSAERFYGKTIVDAFNSELQKMNSRLNVENKNVSERQKKITEANIKLNESIQAVSRAVDVNAPNGGADIRKMFEYLHMSDEDLKAVMEKTEHEPYGQPYYGARPAYIKWAEFELQKLPLDYKGRHELYAATQRRANKLGAFIGDELASAGEKNPSGLPFAASEAHMSMSQYLVDRSMGFDLTPEMKKKAAKPQRMFQPDDYQGGDDYYKSKKNKFESKDEQGFKIRAYHYFDEKTGKYVKNPEALDWMDIGHTNNDKKASMWYLDDNNGKIEQANVSEYPVHEDLFNDIGEEHSIKGRIEYPVYKNGILTKRGRVSIAEPVPSLRDAPDLNELKRIKAKVAYSYGLKVDDIDAFYFGQDEGVKNAFGYGARDQLPVKFQPAEENDYRGVHKAPSGENGEGSLDAMDRTYPEDLYSAQGARYYGSGDKTDKRMHELIMKFRGKPDAMVTVYRAVPKGVDASITKGDWVTPLREYAVLHGNRWEQGMTILEKKVKASELFTEGNSIYEFGWSPKEITEADALRKEIADHEKFMERSRNKAPILWERKGTKIYGQREAMERRLSSLKYELKNIEQESNKPKLQPSEYTEFKSEQSPTGRILRNAKGYVIMMSGNRFRVYNPTKAIIGVYGSEDEAKKRIYREIPKQ